MKRIGSLTLAALLGIATWYAGPGWRAQQQAFAQVAINGIGDDNPNFYLLSYFDVSTSFDASAAGYGGAGSSGGAGDSLMRIVDAGNFEGASVTGDVCANIYVWNDLQELQECCSCPLSGNSLQTSSVINNLLSNPNNGIESLEAGVIKIIGSSGACSNDIATETVTAASLVATNVAEGLHAWLNHTESLASNNPSFTPAFGFITSTSVTAFDTSPLDAGELSRNTTKCANIVADDSTSSKTTGICKCGTGS